MSKKPTPAAKSVDVLKDSGSRRAFSTGAVRDAAKGKGRFDLVPVFGVLSGALQMERGMQKYGARNWEKGMPLSTFLDCALRHMFKALAGFDDEPHWDAATWNLMCLMEGKKRVELGLWPKEFDDLPKTYAGLSPGF